MHPPYTCQVAFEFGAQEPEWQASYPVPKSKKQMLTSAAALKNKISETKSGILSISLYVGITTKCESGLEVNYFKIHLHLDQLH